VPEIRPFRGFRFADTEKLKDLVCPPYDVISPEEQKTLLERHAHNAVRLELPPVESPDEPKAERYKRAALAFEQWRGEGVLKQDDVDTFYVYRQDFVSPSGERRAVTGIVGALTLEPFGENSGVLPHERTMPGPKEDRLALMRACPVNISPIYGIYRGSGELTPFFESLGHRPTTGRFADDSGSLHRMWIVQAPAEVEMLRSAMAGTPLVIADGHHRYETALAFHEEQDGPGEHDAIMCFAVDADGGNLEVLPYNRVFRSDIGDAEIASSLAARFSTKEFPPGGGSGGLAGSSADHPLLFVFSEREILVELTKEEVEARLGSGAPAWRSLDVVALHEVVLAEVLPDGPQEIVFTHDPEDVIARVRDQGWTAGILLKPLRAAEVIDVATSGERMPQKASYFWPKAVTGLAFRALREI
jgi:uncharacterized protein (DUF1015 family)